MKRSFYWGALWVALGFWTINLFLSSIFSSISRWQYGINALLSILCGLIGLGLLLRKNISSSIKSGVARKFAYLVFSSCFIFFYLWLGEFFRERLMGGVDFLSIGAKNFHLSPIAVSLMLLIWASVPLVILAVAIVFAGASSILFAIKIGDRKE